MNANIFLNLKEDELIGISKFLNIEYCLLKGETFRMKSVSLYDYCIKNNLMSKIENVLFVKKIIKTIGFSYAYNKSSDDNIEIYPNEVYEYLLKNGYGLLRDKENLKDTKRIISSFEKKLASQDILLVFVSGSYLRSINCMHELYCDFEIHKFDLNNIIDHTIPIWLDNLDLSCININNLSLFWEERIFELENIFIKSKGQRREQLSLRIQICQDIYHRFSDILYIIKNISMVKMSRDNMKSSIFEIQEIINEKMKIL